MAFNWFKKKEKDNKPKQTPAVESTPSTSRSSVRAASSDAVLKRFYVSEKGTRGMANNQYTFEIARNATKTQVRDAVERAYKVKVVAVNTIRLPSKQRRVGRFVGERPGAKKAIVTLKQGQSIAQAQA